MRVAVATNCIPPYRYPVFRQLSDNPALTLRIFVSLPLDASSELARSTLPIDHPLTINFRLDTRHVEADTRQTEAVPLPMGLIWALLRFWPEVIVSGDFGPRSLLCWLIARIVGAKFLIWTEEIQSSARGRSSLQRKLRRFLLPRADGFFSWGEPARDYLLLEGVALDRITVVPQSIDVDGWNSFRPPQSRDVLRGELGFVGITFLLVGRFVERKGFDRFIKAWSSLPDSATSRAAAVVVGAGELSADLVDLSRKLEARNIIFKGRLNAVELARYYTACDVFVFPSLEDVWGMVVNEALLFGMPVLGSVHAGAVQQLVHDGETGSAFDPNDIREFTRRLLLWIDAAPRFSRDACRALAESLHPTVGANAISARLLRELSD